jgi:hypothetical protein
LIGDVLDWLFEHRSTATQAGPLAATLAIQADSAVANIVRLAEEMPQRTSPAGGWCAGHIRKAAQRGAGESVKTGPAPLAGGVAVGDRGCVGRRLAAAVGDALTRFGSARCRNLDGELEALVALMALFLVRSTLKIAWMHGARETSAMTCSLE